MFLEGYELIAKEVHEFASKGEACSSRFELDPKELDSGSTLPYQLPELSPIQEKED